MKLVIPRGIVYHKVIDDILSLIQAVFAKLDDVRKISKFEQQFADYIDCKYCIAFPFARTAIYAALKLQNLPEGAEIIMPPITIKPMLDVVLDLKLRPVFVDLDPNTLCFDLEQLKAAITANTKAILITYLFGIVPNMEQLIALCREKNLFVIEDFSHCLNGKYRDKKIGSFGNVGIYSASSIKTFDTYGGGLAVTNNDELANKLRNAQTKLLG